MLEFKSVLSTMCQLKTPFGSERSGAELITKLAEPYCDNARTDALGNLILHRAGIGKKLMLTAPISTPGFMITRIENDGRLRFSAFGSGICKDINHVPVELPGDVRGVLVRDEKKGAEESSLDSCYIDIGAEDRDGALKLVSIGDAAVFYGTPQSLGSNLICGANLTSRAAAAIVLTVLSAAKTEYDLYAVFTAQDVEGLRRGVKTAAFDLAPELLIELAGVRTRETEDDLISLGRGPVIKIMDGSVVMNREITAALRDTAAKLGGFQLNIEQAGNSAAGAAQLTRGGVRTGGIAYAVRHQHSPFEMVCSGDIQACAELLHAVLEQAALS